LALHQPLQQLTAKPQQGAAEKRNRQYIPTPPGRSSQQPACSGKNHHQGAGNTVIALGFEQKFTQVLVTTLQSLYLLAQLITVFFQLRPGDALLLWHRPAWFMFLIAHYLSA